MSVLFGKGKVLAIGSCVASLLALSMPVPAQDFDRGQALYENHCKECHEAQAHTRHTSKINSMAEIRSWVASWSVHSKLDWTGEEINDVANYLNKKFYHLSEKP